MFPAASGVGNWVLATIWSRFFQRGPLEWLMGRATGIARRVQ
ncbi:DUF418 domain-containing protein [Streptomyces sp. NBC_00576]|nr:DUF418 domain-containing protein [Streptomyces sp. NBC_00576]WUB74675.1 DUF418 domain-containing protein [Streptomyces sp. NBC_00576]